MLSSFLVLLPSKNNQFLMICAIGKQQCTCSRSSISWFSVTRPLNWPDCAILKSIPSICLDRSGLTSAIRDTEVIRRPNENDQKITRTKTYAFHGQQCREPSTSSLVSFVPLEHASLLHLQIHQLELLPALEKLAVSGLVPPSEWQ